jgi:hypothetical protein
VPSITTAAFFRIVDLRAIANEVGGADDTERPREAGADNEHHDGADDRQNDLGLNHGRRSRRRAPPAGAEGQHGTEGCRKRQRQDRTRDHRGV